MRGLFIARSPFQLICNAEAKAHFGIDDAHLLIRRDALPRNTAQMDEIAKITAWSSIRVVDHSTKQLLRLAREMRELRHAARSPRFDYIFSTDFPSPYFDNVDAGRRFVLDDGLVTIDLQRHFATPKAERPKTYIGNPSRLQKVLKPLLGLKTNSSEAYDLFTCFDVKPLPGQDVQKNTFAYLRCLASDQATEDFETLYLLGGGYVGAGLLPPDRYVQMILRSIAHFNNDGRKRIVYMPHRNQKAEVLDELKTRVRGLEVHRPTYPVEYEFLHRRVIPTKLVSFLSTAVYTLRLIFPKLDIRTVQFPLSEFPETFRDSIEFLNRYLTENGFQIEVLTLP